MIYCKQILLMIFATNLLFAQPKQIWVDSTYQSLTLDQKIGQLFMSMVFSQGDQSHYQKISEDLKKYHLGGLFFQKEQSQNRYDLPIYFKTKVKYLYSSLWMRSGDGNATQGCKTLPISNDIGSHSKR